RLLHHARPRRHLLRRPVREPAQDRTRRRHHLADHRHHLPGRDDPRLPALGAQLRRPRGRCAEVRAGGSGGGSGSAGGFRSLGAGGSRGFGAGVTRAGIVYPGLTTARPGRAEPLSFPNGGRNRMHFTRKSIRLRPPLASPERTTPPNASLPATCSGSLHSAEAVGFEPTVRGCRTTVFKTASFGRSDTLPLVLPCL